MRGPPHDGQGSLDKEKWLRIDPRSGRKLRIEREQGREALPSEALGSRKARGRPTARLRTIEAHVRLQAAPRPADCFGLVSRTHPLDACARPFRFAQTLRFTHSNVTSSLRKNRKESERQVARCGGE